MTTTMTAGGGPRRRTRTDEDERRSAATACARILRRPEVGAAVAGPRDLPLLLGHHGDASLKPSGASTWIFDVVGVRHHGGRGRPADDRRRVRPVRRRDDRHHRPDDRHLDDGVRAANVWVVDPRRPSSSRSPSAPSNGILVMRTGLPSFIVTLGTFFVLQGVNLAVTKALDRQGVAHRSRTPTATPTASSSSARSDQRLQPLADDGDLTLYAATFWWIGVTVVATWVLLRTRPGNWIFAVGGAQQSARQVGVPVFRTKVGLFMTTAVAGWLVGMLRAVQDHDGAEHRPVSVRSSSSSSAPSSVAAC